MGTAVSSYFPQPPLGSVGSTLEPWGCSEMLRVPGAAGLGSPGLIADSPNKCCPCHPRSPGQPSRSHPVVSVPPSPSLTSCIMCYHLGFFVERLSHKNGLKSTSESSHGLMALVV